MDESPEVILGCLIGFMIGILITLLFIWKSDTQWQNEAVKHGAAEYNITTGEWQWKSKAEESSKE